MSPPRPFEFDDGAADRGEQVWQVECRNRDAEAIAERAGPIYAKFVDFLEDMDEIGQHLDQALEFYDHAMNALSPGERQPCPPGKTPGEAGTETGEAAPSRWLRHLGPETGPRTSVAARKIRRYVTRFTHVFVRREIFAGDSDFSVIIGIVGLNKWDAEPIREGDDHGELRICGLDAARRFPGSLCSRAYLKDCASYDRGIERRRGVGAIAHERSSQLVTSDHFSSVQNGSAASSPKKKDAISLCCYHPLIPTEGKDNGRSR